MRRVLESLFRYFDNGLWPISDGVAYPVLKDMQFLMDDSGTQILLLTYFLPLGVLTSVLKVPT